MLNSYGVDVNYFRRELKNLLHTIDNRTPGELQRYLLSLANIASDKLATTSTNSSITPCDEDGCKHKATVHLCIKIDDMCKETRECVNQIHREKFKLKTEIALIASKIEAHCEHHQCAKLDEYVMKLRQLSSF